jgi:lysophospholipase
MQLFGIDGNPVPSGGVVGEVIAADGVRLRYARWRPSGRRATGTICLLQGRGECIEKYFEVIGELRGRGFAVATFDWRGQGGSERRLGNPRKCHVDTFAEYDRDLDAFMEQVVLPDCPPHYYALAQSSGGLVCLRAAHDGRARFTRMVLTAPMVALAAGRGLRRFACRLAAAMTAAGLGELDAPGDARRTIHRLPFEDNPLTGDAGRFERNRGIALTLPQVSVDGPTYGWLFAACRAMTEADDPDFAPGIKVPVLVVSGALDRVLSARASEALAAELRAGGQVVIAGARHEVLMERDSIRDQFWGAFDAFVPGS